MRGMVNAMDLIDDVDGCEERRCCDISSSILSGCVLRRMSKQKITYIPGHAEAPISDRIPKLVVSRPIPSYGQGNNEKVR